MPYCQPSNKPNGLSGLLRRLAYPCRYSDLIDPLFGGHSNGKQLRKLVNLFSLTNFSFRRKKRRQYISRFPHNGRTSRVATTKLTDGKCESEVKMKKPVVQILLSLCHASYVKSAKKAAISTKHGSILHLTSQTLHLSFQD